MRQREAARASSSDQGGGDPDAATSPTPSIHKSLLLLIRRVLMRKRDVGRILVKRIQIVDLSDCRSREKGSELTSSKQIHENYYCKTIIDQRKQWYYQTRPETNLQELEKKELMQRRRREERDQKTNRGCRNEEDLERNIKEKLQKEHQNFTLITNSIPEFQFFNKILMLYCFNYISIVDIRLAPFIDRMI